MNALGGFTGAVLLAGFALFMVVESIDRFIHPVTKTADKCDFCRKTNLQAGKLPACVEACPTKALTFGNLDDPNSEISQLLRQKPTYRYKLALGTKPKLYRVPFKYGEVSQ